MKVAAFYAVCVIMLCVMAFGGIEGFSFKLRVDTGEFSTYNSGLSAEQVLLASESQQKWMESRETTPDKTSLTNRNGV
jgi:hypothetical protein